MEAVCLDLMASSGRYNGQAKGMNDVCTTNQVGKLITLLNYYLMHHLDQVKYYLLGTTAALRVNRSR